MEHLKLWLSAEHGRGARLAVYLGVVPSFVTKMALGDKPIPVQHGAAIEQFTGGALTRQQMFPNDWQRIWPELATPNATHPEPTTEQEAANA